ncbi:MAG: 4-oxalomesaconate tautomerase [Pelagibacterium sp. SCN 64-44]|nr:MAG: 4-oxalomesaconate tautomerase [Pelagibacterium sp. SCN 64-44]
MSDTGTRVMWMRGGTSKGGFFLAEDLPADPAERDALLLRIMGSPDSRQIDGMGGANPLTSKVAVVKKSERPGVDVDYLFLQVFVDKALVSDAQNCGNMLAAVGPFAIERGLKRSQSVSTKTRIYMENTGQVAEATVSTPGGVVSYSGDTHIDGVPGTAAPIPLVFEDIAGSSCGALLPTGNAVDRVCGVDVTLIDNGMPCVILDAADFGLSGYEGPLELEANAALRARLEEIRLAAGPLMNLGDVAKSSVPKMTLVSPPQRNGIISTRSFIPHRCHDAIGVLAAVTVASACLLPEGPAARHAAPTTGSERLMSVEHPTGEFTVIAHLDEAGHPARAGVMRTARKLMDGVVF